MHVHRHRAGVEVDHFLLAFRGRHRHGGSYIMAALFSWSPRHFDIHLFIFSPQFPGTGLTLYIRWKASSRRVFHGVSFCNQ